MRRGGTSVTARPARGAGGGPGLVGRGFEAGVPGPAARGRHRLRAHGQRLVRLHGVRRRRARPRDLRPGVRRRHGHQGGLVPRAPEQATSWAASHGGMDGLAHRSGHGTRRIGLVYATGVGEFGMPPPAGTAGDPYGNAMAEGADGAYRTGLVRRRKPFWDPRDPESATFRWVSWRGLEASAPALGPQDTGTDRNRVLCKPSGASRPTIRTEKSGHIKAQAVNS